MPRAESGSDCPRAGPACATARERARQAAPIFYALRQARLPRLPLRVQGWVPSPARGDSPPCTSPRATARAPRRTRLRDARRAAAHQARLSAKGLRLRAPTFVPEDFPVGGGGGYVPGKLGRRGRRARVPLHPGRTARPTRSRPRHVPSGRRAPGSPRPRWCLGPCVSCVSSGARAALCHATWSRRRSPPLLMRVLATAIRCHAPRSPGVSRLCRARGADVRRGRSPALRRCGRIASSPHYRTWPWGARPLPRLTLAQARRCRARRKRCGAACTRAS